MQRRTSNPGRVLKAPLEVYQKRLEMAEELLNELQDLADRDSIIVVEGKRDIAALRSLGVNGDLRPSTHYPLMDFCEGLSITGKKVVILTDWDRRGDLLASKLVKNLQSLGSTPDTRIRGLIVSLVQKEIKDVESLPGYIGKLKKITKTTDVTDPF
jgi:5S rRNA maturation endonuclease (ribonuclease M5)